MTLKSIFTTERILWLGVVLFILFLFKRCGDNNSAKLEAIKADAAKLLAKHHEDSIAFAAQVARWQDSINRADINSELQVKVIKETEKKLENSQATIKRLTFVIRNDQFRDTTNMILVSSDYKAACDSLPAEIDKQNEVIGQLHKDNEGLVDLMNYEVVYRDSLIEAGKEYIDSLRRDYSHQKTLLETALKTGKPRGQFLIGAGIIGNQEQLLSGASFKAGYLTKGGKMYQYSTELLKAPGMESAKLFHELSILVNPFK